MRAWEWGHVILGLLKFWASRGDNLSEYIEQWPVLAMEMGISWFGRLCVREKVTIVRVSDLNSSFHPFPQDDTIMRFAA